MGTRADFYVEKEDKKLDWLGSIGWDGYPGGIPQTLLEAKTVDDFKTRVKSFIQSSKGTPPEMGWPWPWETSSTTDYGYIFISDKVMASCFGGSLFDPMAEEEADEDSGDLGVSPNYPDMSALKNVTLDPLRSGIIVIGG